MRGTRKARPRESRAYITQPETRRGSENEKATLAVRGVSTRAGVICNARLIPPDGATPLAAAASKGARAQLPRASPRTAASVTLYMNVFLPGCMCVLVYSGERELMENLIDRAVLIEASDTRCSRTPHAGSL